MADVQNVSESLVNKEILSVRHLKTLQASQSDLSGQVRASGLEDDDEYLPPPGPWERKFLNELRWSSISSPRYLRQTCSTS